jgi:hypothetical protein
MKKKYLVGKGDEAMDGFVTKTMEQFFKDNPPKDFQPCAYYDKHLDCIRVQIRDCSFTEIRLNRIITIYRANHVDNVEHMGFSIKGIMHLFEKFQLPKNVPYILADIINEIVRDDPEGLCEFVQKEFAQNLNLEVKDIQDLQEKEAA